MSRKTSKAQSLESSNLSNTTVVTDYAPVRNNHNRHLSDVVKTSLQAKLEARTLINSEPCLVVMPLDDSCHSNYCIHFYIQFIHKPDNTVFVCYVAGDYLRNKTSLGDITKDAPKSGMRRTLSNFLKCKFQTKELGPSPGILAELEQKDRAQCHIIKAQVKDLFSTNNVKYQFHKLSGVDPWTAILNFRKQVNGSLIVMGSRGQGVLRRSIFGSVSDKILKNSEVPVMVVKQPLSHSTYVIVHGIPESLIH